MKDLSLLVWLTQLGLSTVSPLAGCVLLAVWLQRQCHWGNWVIWTGAILGSILAIDGFRTSIKLMARISRSKKDPEPPPVSFNEHN